MSDALSLPSGSVSAATGGTPPSVATRSDLPGAAANQGIGVTDGIGTPTPSSPGRVRGMRAANFARLEVAVDAQPRPPLPRGYSRKWCVPCNRRDAAHLNGRCVMEHTHG